MITNMEDRIAKLPEWARDHINRLAQSLELAKRALSEFEDRQSWSAVSYDELVCENVKGGPTTRTAYLQTTNVEFQLGNKGDHRSSVDVRIVDGELRISAGGRIVLTPQAANCIVLKLEK